MKTKYEIAFAALKSCPSSRSYNLSQPEGFHSMYRDMWIAITKAGIRVTKNQALRAFMGPENGYWTLMDMAEYLAARAK